MLFVMLIYIGFPLVVIAVTNILCGESVESVEVISEITKQLPVLCGSCFFFF